MEENEKDILLMEVFEAAPKSERTLAKWGYQVIGAELLNDFGYPCTYRVVVGSTEVGAIKYYRGRLLVALQKGGK